MDRLIYAYSQSTNSTFSYIISCREPVKAAGLGMSGGFGIHFPAKILLVKSPTVGGPTSFLNWSFRLDLFLSHSIFSDSSTSMRSLAVEHIHTVVEHTQKGNEAV